MSGAPPKSSSCWGSGRAASISGSGRPDRIHVALPPGMASTHPKLVASYSEGNPVNFQSLSVMPSAALPRWQGHIRRVPRMKVATRSWKRTPKVFSAQASSGTSSVFFSHSRVCIVDSRFWRFGEIQLFLKKINKNEIFKDFSKIFEKMTHSKTEIGQKLQKRVFSLGFSVVVFGARRAPEKCRLWKKGIKKTLCESSAMSLPAAQSIVVALTM